MCARARCNCRFREHDILLFLVAFTAATCIWDRSLIDHTASLPYNWHMYWQLTPYSLCKSYFQPRARNNLPLPNVKRQPHRRATERFAVTDLTSAAGSSINDVHVASSTRAALLRALWSPLFYTVMVFTVGGVAVQWCLGAQSTSVLSPRPPLLYSTLLCVWPVFPA